jgi:hypothetical protein
MSSSPSGPTKSDIISEAHQELVRNPFRIPILAAIVALAFTDAITQDTARLLITALLGAVIGTYYDIIADASYVVFEKFRLYIGDKISQDVDVGLSVLFAICAIAAAAISFDAGSTSGLAASGASFLFFVLRALIINRIETSSSPETPQPY